MLKLIVLFFKNNNKICSASDLLEDLLYNLQILTRPLSDLLIKCVENGRVPQPRSRLVMKSRAQRGKRLVIEIGQCQPLSSFQEDEYQIRTGKDQRV